MQIQSRLRIVHVLESFAAGVLSVIVNVSNYQATLGHEVHIVHSLREESPADFRRLFHPDISLHYLRMTREVNPVRDVLALLKLNRTLSILRPDVLHLHSSKAGFLGRLAAYVRGLRRVFYSPHGVSLLRLDVSPAKRRAYAALEKFASLFGGCVIACSESEYRIIQDTISPGQLVVVENGINTESFREKSYSLRSIVRIGTAGRITAQKNPKAFARIASALTNYEFVWIGDGPAEDKKHLEGAPIKIMGWMQRSAAIEAIADLDLYVQTSLWEGMPLTVIEAMALGLPVVVLDSAGNRDVVNHGETGFIARNESELFTYLELLATNGELRQRFGQAARRIALRQYSDERMNRELLDLYTGVSEKPSKRRNCVEENEATLR